MAEIFGISGVTSFDAVNVAAVAVLLVVLAIVIIKCSVLGRRTKSLHSMVDEMDTEKADMYSKLKNFEEENVSLRERFDNMQKDYSEKMQIVEEKEKTLDANSKEVESKLLEIKAMEDTIEMHRAKIGRLEIEKSDMERKLDSATKNVDKIMSSEKEKLKSTAAELKQKTRETLVAVTKENEDLKKKYETVKERLSLWEAVKDS